MPLERVGLEGVFDTTGFMQGIKQYESGVAKISKSTTTATAGLNKQAAATINLQSAMSSLVKAGAITTLVSGIKEVINTTVDWQNEIKKIVDITDMSWESSSRLVAISDDMGISSDELVIAFKKLSSEGHAPTLDTLMKVSDEYLKLETQEQRNAYANEMLGRSYDDLLPLLKLGSAGIAEAAANVNKGLLVQSGKDLAEYTKALNNFNEAQQAAKMSLGKAFLPGTSALMQGVADIFDISSWEDAAQKLIKFNVNFFQLEEHLPNLRDQLVSAGLDLEAFGFSVEGVTDDLGADDVGGLAYTIDAEALPALDKLIGRTKTGGTRMDHLGGSIRNVAESGESSKKDFEFTAENVHYIGSEAGKAEPKVDDFAGSINETEYAARDAYPWLDVLSGFFVNRAVQWVLTFVTGGNVPGEWYSDWQDLDETDWSQHLIDEQEFFGMASGGNASPGAYVVGERGPELLFLGRAGQIISNAEIIRALSDMQDMPIFSQAGIASSGSGMSMGSSEVTNNWNFKMNTLSGPDVIQRSARTAQLLFG